MALNYTNPGWTNDDEPYIDANNLNDISDNLEEACDLIGNETMGTTATTITGGIKELVTKIGNTVIGTVSTTITSAIKAIQDKLANYSYNSATNSFEIYAGAANIRMSETESVFNVWLSDNNRITLGGPNNESQLVTLRAGNSYLTVNNTAGNATLLLSDTRYININSSVVYLKSGDVTASLNDTNKRFIINASGGLYVNGTLVDPTTTTSSVSIKIGSGSTYSGTIVRNGKIRIYNFYYEVSSPVGTISLTTPIGTLSANDKPYAEETGTIVGLTSSAWSSATTYPMAVMINNAGQILMRGNPTQIAQCNVFRGQIVWAVS